MLISPPTDRPAIAPPEIGASPVSPYPGLRPFGERDARLFFGRERETASLLNSLEKQQLVVVHGASGCGKSSLVRAGIIPFFRMDAAAASKIGHVVIVRPADVGGPLQSLGRKLDQELGPPAAESRGSLADEPSWAQLLTTSSDWTRDISSRVGSSRVGDAHQVLCIIFDQFEEIFAANRAGFGAQVRRVIEFLNSLSEAAPAGSALGGRSLSVVVTMRSDYLGQCAAWEGFAETVNRCQYLLPRITNFGLLKAIHEPARLSGGAVDDGVAEQLLGVAKSEMDGLPIVQHALMRAWQSQSASGAPIKIGLETLNAVGGAGSALSNHADEVWLSATAGDPALATTADWMLRSLSDLDSDGRIIRRSPTLEQLIREVGTTRQTIETVLRPFRLQQNSLIMPPIGEHLHDNTVVSVSHEALLRQWDRISGTGFDELGRLVGLAYREFQDGMIWRALSVQASQFARDGTSILGPAATEQRLPWYREIQQRRGWIGRHQMETWSFSASEAQRRWDEVAEFMGASELNMTAEAEKLENERQLVADLTRSQRIQRRLQLVVAGLVIILSVLGWFEFSEKVEQAKIAEQKTLAALEAKKKAQVDLYAADTRNANFMANRFCLPRYTSASAAYQRCMLEQSQRYLEAFKTSRLRMDETDKLPASPHGGLPVSPYGGGFVDVTQTKEAQK